MGGRRFLVSTCVAAALLGGSPLGRAQTELPASADDAAAAEDSDLAAPGGVGAASAPEAPDEPVASSSVVAADEEQLDAEVDAEQGPDQGAPAWRRAASLVQQRRARQLFQEGNQLVKESLFVQAAERYEAALAQWDHPGIHYNLALALINLDQPVRLRQHLIESLKFGDEALGKDKARRANQYIALVEKQLTEVVIRCSEAGARVELDGEFLFVAPGEERRFVRPGQHTIRATAPGFETTERSLAFIAGEEQIVPVRLYQPEDWIQTERRWKPWGPIVVTASGAAVLGVGAALYGVGAGQVRDFDARVGEQCSDGGCAPGQIDESPDRGVNLQGAGIGAIAVGGATLITGGVLLYLNRPIPHRVDPEAGDRLSLRPVVTPGMVGLTGRGVF